MQACQAEVPGPAEHMCSVCAPSPLASRCPGRRPRASWTKTPGSKTPSLRGGPSRHHFLSSVALLHRHFVKRSMPHTACGAEMIDDLQSVETEPRRAPLQVDKAHKCAACQRPGTVLIKQQVWTICTKRATRSAGPPRLLAVPHGTDTRRLAPLLLSRPLPLQKLMVQGRFVCLAALE